MKLDPEDDNGVGFTDSFQVTINRADEVMVSPTGDNEKWYCISPGELWNLLHELYRSGKLVPIHSFSSSDTEYVTLARPYAK
jgi:hypothetical protein